jgi:hypothetical protein
MTRNVRIFLFQDLGEPAAVFPVFRHCSTIDPLYDVISLRNQTVEILLKKFKLVQIFGIEDVNAVLAVHELNNRAVVFPDRHVIIDYQAFQLLDQASLQVARPAGFDGCVNQAFSAGHAVEIEVLGTQACEESVGDVATASWVWVIR